MSSQFSLPFTLPPPALTREDFLVTASNRNAYAWLVDKTPTAWPGHAFVVHGPEGCGKTHLLAIWAAQNGAEAVRVGDTALFKHDKDLPRAVVLDDADHVAGDDVQEEWLQHLYNAMKGRHLLLASRKAPTAWGLRLADIASRIAGSMAVAIQEPDDDLLMSLLIKQFGDRQMDVSPDVVMYLAKHMERSGAAVREVVEGVYQKVIAEHRTVTVPFAREVLTLSRPPSP